MKAIKRKKAQPLGQRLDRLTPAQRREVARLLREHIEKDVARGRV